MLTERLDAPELMDDPALDHGIYHRVLADLEQVNRVTMAYRPTLAFLRRAVGMRREFRLLDVGFGRGDMLRRIARWTQRRGAKAELVGIDLNPRSAHAALAATPGHLPIRYETGDYAELAGQGWDCIISSLVAHHMSRAELVAFLRFMEREAQTGWFINDLHRHSFAWLSYPILARVMSWHRIVRLDGTTSIARSYRPEEWPPLLAEAGIWDARVKREFPFRLCVERLR